MSVTVGIDGGQSTIRIRTGGFTRETPGVSHLNADANQSVVDAIAGLLRDTSSIERLVAGLTTLPPTAKDRSKLAETLAIATNAKEVWVGGDEATAHAGAFGGEAGVVLSAGTGVACYAFDPASGTARHFDGAGYLIGDEGAGFWIGSRGIRAAIAANEGRGPSTILMRLVASSLGHLDFLGAELHRGERPVDTIAQAAALVLQAHSEGDDVAEEILTNAASRLAVTATTAQAHIGPKAPIALAGRLLQPASPLHALATTAILDIAPNTTISTCSGVSLKGASNLAATGQPSSYRELFTIHRSQS